MKESPRQTARVGLCASCKHVRAVRSDRDSVFYQCKRAATDPHYPLYPILPVLRCGGFEQESGVQSLPTEISETD